MTGTPPPTFADLLERFALVLQGRNRSPHTRLAYTNDVTQFATWLEQQQPSPSTSPAAVTRTQLDDYLGHLAQAGYTGVSRARKLSALREFFRYLVQSEILATSPVEGVQPPRREQKLPVYLTRSEYSRLLALAGTHPRDFAALTVLLQTGLRVSELCALALDDVDLKHKTLRVRVGKGQVERVIELERKSVKALTAWRKARPAAASPRLFLNRFDAPLGERGVKKLIAKYREQAGLTKHFGPHGLRHTFATAKAEQGVNPFLLQDWLGHRSLTTTQRYVHLARTNAQKVMEDTSL